MEYLKQIFNRLAEIVKRMSVSQVVMLVAIIAGFIVGIVAVAGWIGNVNYQPLYTNLEPAEAAEITSYLAENKIPYKLDAGGTAISVAESDLYEARLKLAAQGLPNSGTVGYSIFDETKLGMTDFLQKLNFRRALEGELARTISGLHEVQAARVHIVIPEQRLFSEQQEEATASVVLKLRGSSGLTRTQLAGITNLVASSVEGLKPNSITVVDYYGNMLSSATHDDGIGAMSASQLELTHATEKDLEQKAQTMLDGVLGPGKSIVRVTAELNFEQYSRTSENFDPNQVAIRSEQRTEQNNQAAKKSAENAEDSKDESSEVTVTNYEVSKTVETLNNAIGTIKRISVAVLLDGTYKTVGGDGGVQEKVYEPRPQEEIDRLSAIVKNAVGFSGDRNDQLEVVNIAFDKTYLDDQQKLLDEQFSHDFYYNIGKKIFIVLAVFLLLFYLRKKLKSFFTSLKAIIPPPSRRAAERAAVQQQRQEAAEEEEEEYYDIQAEKRRPKLVDQMQRVAKDDPEEIAKVIKTLMVE